MKSMTIIIFTVVAIALTSVGMMSEDKQAEKSALDGKVIFTSAKCGTCHYVSKFELGKKPVEGKPNAAPDLSTVGSKYPVAFMTKYLRKSESIKGKKHMVSFKGSDVELSALVGWLDSLKEKTNK
ncbi:MAG: c-type cytochrome [candidate division Zixibacteria bacterium]|nr:c-type cytochrome [candidate division Zixibacteria bacterium]